MTRIYPFQKTARWLSLGFLAMALLLGGWATTWAQEEDAQEQEKPKIKLTPIDINSIPKEALRIGEPAKPAALSPHHEMLNKLVGHWAAQARMHLEPGAEPVESRGTATSKLILGGTALQTEYKGQLVGETFAGLGFDGYDIDQGHHFSFWIDSTNTGASYASGDCNHEGMDVVTLIGGFKDPETGEDVERKTILTVRSTSRYTYEEWHTRGDGEPTLAMQIIFTKVR